MGIHFKARRADKLCAALFALRLFAFAAAAANFPPTGNIGAPPSDTVFGIGDTIEFRANAFDPENALTKMEFYVDGVFIGEDFIPPYSMEWSTNTVGVYSFHVVAVDDAFARGTSFVSHITVTNLGPRNITWNPTTYLYPTWEWNGTSINWLANSRPTVFRSGDSVSITLGLPLFIGTDGVPAPVSPASTIFRNSGSISGGDILTGGLVCDVGTRVTFSNYTSSLSFPGGTLIQPSPGITFDVSGALPGAAIHFGTGAITNDSTTFTLQTGDAGITFENDFVIRGGNPNTLNINPAIRPSASVRFTGTLQLGGTLDVRVYSDTSIPRPFHEWAGPIVLRQDGPRPLRMTTPSSPYPKGLIISGGISDGPGPATNGVVFSGYLPIRLTGTNTYSHGTRVETFGSPYPFEVAPESSLGTGDLEVLGSITLLGSRNLASNANVSLLGGRTYLGRGVKIRLNSLKLGNTIYTNGLFAGTNIIYNNYITSNGSFRLPSVNLDPTVSITNPPSDTAFLAGENISLRAAVADIDSYITQVEFRLNGATFAVRTNAPFESTLREAPAGIYRVQALAYDDDGGVGSSSMITVNVQPRIDRISTVLTNVAMLEFDAPLLSPYALEYADILPDWSNLVTFPAESIRRQVRYTNAVPENLPSRFYRLRVP